MVDDAVLAAGRVRVEQSGPVLTVTLDRPDQLNAQTPATWRALAAVGGDLPADVRVVVLRGRRAVVLGRAGPGHVHAEGLPGEPSLFTLAALDDAALDAAIAASRPPSPGGPRCRP